MKTDQILLISSKSTRIDPRHLAPAEVPARIIDYGIMLRPDSMLEQQYRSLKPLRGTTGRSWNHFTTVDCSATPLAVSIETKAPYKSWTDGKAQLGIWASAFTERLKLLHEHKKMQHHQYLHQPLRSNSSPMPSIGDVVAASADEFRVPCFPMIVAQGADWHVLLVTWSKESSLVVHFKIDIGSSRSCYDLYKLLASLHVICHWAETTWRPWFNELVGK